MTTTEANLSIHNPATKGEGFALRPLIETDGIIDVAAGCSDLLDAWLSTLGPGSTVLWIALARYANAPGIPWVMVADLGAWSGLAPEHVTRCIHRLSRFGRVRYESGGTLSVYVTAAVR